MLWSRSASLMRTTRMSSAIARNILRMFSACCCSWLWVLNLDSLVTPSTMWATSGPNRSSTSARLYSVSSATSWRSAAETATGSMPSSARICADAMGCVTYGSPDARTWLACASTARSNARLTIERSACGWCLPIAASSWRRRASRSRVIAGGAVTAIGPVSMSVSVPVSRGSARGARRGGFRPRRRGPARAGTSGSRTTWSGMGGSLPGRDRGAPRRVARAWQGPGRGMRAAAGSASGEPEQADARSPEMRRSPASVTRTEVRWIGRSPPAPRSISTRPASGPSRISASRSPAADTPRRAWTTAPTRAATRSGAESVTAVGRTPSCASTASASRASASAPPIVVDAETFSPPPESVIAASASGRPPTSGTVTSTSSPSTVSAVRSTIATSPSTTSSEPIPRPRNVACVAWTRTRSAWSPRRSVGGVLDTITVVSSAWRPAAVIPAVSTADAAAGSPT